MVVGCRFNLKPKAQNRKKKITAYDRDAFRSIVVDGS